MHIGNETVFGDGWRFCNGMNAELRFISIERGVETDFLLLQNLLTSSKLVFLLLFQFGGLCFEGGAAKLWRAADPLCERFHVATPTSRILHGKSVMSPQNFSFGKEQQPPPCSGATDGFVHHCENSRTFYMFTAYVYHE